MILDDTCIGPDCGTCDPLVETDDPFWPLSNLRAGLTIAIFGTVSFAGLVVYGNRFRHFRQLAYDEEEDAVKTALLANVLALSVKDLYLWPRQRKPLLCIRSRRPGTVSLS